MNHAEYSASLLAPEPLHRRWRLWKQSFSSTATVGVGTPDLGTISGTGGTSAVQDDDGWWVNYATAASSSGRAGNWSTSAQEQLRHNPLQVTTIRTPSTMTSIRFWIGLLDALEEPVFDNNNPDSWTSPAPFIGFRYSTSASDTGWAAVCAPADGVTAATVVPTGFPVSASTRYALVVDARDPYTITWAVGRNTSRPGVPFDFTPLLTRTRVSLGVGPGTYLHDYSFATMTAVNSLSASARSIQWNKTYQSSE
jgi:hypothetical protein